VGTNFISELEVPYTFTEWQGQDVSKKLNINTADTTFNFINKALANQYINSKGERLLFIILDAGNFHHPKVCFTGAGYKIKELDDTEFHTPDRSFKAHTLFTERGSESSLSFYWIVIDKKISHAWIEQKFKQLYFSMLSKQRVGLMVRLDIPAKKDNIEEAMIMAKQFINDLSQTLQSEQAGYVFGEK
jgi:EpsI family protein